MAHLRRLLLDRQPAQDVVARELVLGALQLTLGDALGLELVELGDQRLLHVIRRLARIDECDGIEDAGGLQEAAAAERGQGEAGLVDQLAIDPRGLAVGQRLRHHEHRIRIGMAVVGRLVRHHHRRQRPGLLEVDPALLGVHRLLRDVARHRRRRLGDAGEVLIHQADRVVRLEVAGDQQRGVVRHVVGVVERADIINGRRIEVVHAADHRVLVGMHVEGMKADQLVQQAERRILDAHAALFLHHLALGDEGLLVHAQARHAIGFHPQRQRQVLRRNGLMKHRRVLVGIGVGLATNRGDDRRVLFGLDVLGALEHHVLEEMREAGPARLLVLRTHVVPQLDLDNRRRLVLVQDHDHAIGEHETLVLQLRRADGRLQRHHPEHGADGHNPEEYVEAGLQTRLQRHGEFPH